MSFTANQYWTTYDVGTGVGSSIREDLLDLITNIDPWDTPFFSSAPKTQSKHVLHEWLVDSLAATSTAGAVEGDDFSGSTALVNRGRLNNLQHIFRKDIAVSDTLQALNPAGLRDEYEYQVMKALREIARNIEATIFRVGAAASATGVESSGARVMAGLRGFITATATTGNVSAVNGAITTAHVINLHQQVYQLGGNPDTLYVSPGVKRAFTANVIASSAQNVRNIAAVDKKAIQNIDVFESDFGLLAVVPDRFMPQTTATATASAASAWLIERSKARISFLRPIKHVPIGKGGDSTRGFVRGELTLEVLHPSAHGCLFGVTDV